MSAAAWETGICWPLALTRAAWDRGIAVPPLVRPKAMSGPGDKGEPVITMMLRDEN